MKENVETAAQQAANAKELDHRRRESETNRKLLILILILLLVIVLGAVGFVVYALYGSEGKTEVDLVNNIDVADLGLTGYEGEGILEYDEKYLASLIEYNGTNAKVKKFLSGVSYTVTPDTDISNGDKITIKAEYDAGAAKRAGVKVTKDTKHLVIEQLDEKDEDGYNYGNSDTETESTDTFDDPEDDYSGNGNQDYTGNDMYSGSGILYQTMTASGKDGYINVREGPSTDDDVVVKLTNGIRIDVYDLKDGWYKIATGAYKGKYVHESTLSEPE